MTNGTVADVLILYGIHQDGIKLANVSGFIVETNTPGLRTGQVFHKMGLRTSPICEIVLENCKVPESNLLGRERLGIVGFNKSMYWERILMSAYHLGAMSNSLILSLNMLKIENSFGQ